MNLQKLKFRRAFVCLVIVAALVTACKSAKSKSASYDFASITKGTVERIVSATGTIYPVAEVNVLPQMSGKVETLNVDYNDKVKKGDILAVLNTDMLKLQREQQAAAVQKAKANFDLQQVNYANQQALAAKNLISDFELKTSKTTLDNNAADLATAQANLNVIETEINQYAYVTSPIDGIVLDRKINLGDTVVDSSSTNSSYMFTLAENLNEMQIQAAVSELDVPSIHLGQTVRFTLESMPGRTFTGEVQTLRMVPVVTNNVVSYTVVVSVDNQDGSLLPGMTCSCDFVVQHVENVLTVPNAALRFQPTTLTDAEVADMVFNASIANLSDADKKAAIDARAQAMAQAAQSAQSSSQNSGLAGLMGGANMRRLFNNRSQGNNQGLPHEAVTMRNLWYIGSDGKLGVMRVPTGITDGTSTEVRSQENLEGRQIILREKVNASN